MSIHRLRQRPAFALLLVALILAGCGGSAKTVSIQWHTPTATPQSLVVATTEPTASPTQAAQPTADQTEPTPAPARNTGGAEGRWKVNELGYVPILEYHAFTPNPEEDAPFIRYIGYFQEDLQWLYDNDFYIVPLRDIVLNEIKAPKGKRPVALTFDDSTAGQFRYLPQADGSLMIDPNSAIYILEEFYAAHPDFGRGGFFAALAPKNVCFSWVEEDQEPYCEQKIKYLLDKGYEIGNHTLNHLNLSELSDAEVISELAEPFLWWPRIDDRIWPDILSVPFGAYPESLDVKKQMRNGFVYEGVEYQLIACLMVGSQPMYSPNSTEWDPLWVARIQVADNGEWGNSRYWFGVFEQDPGMLYVSDGDPNTVTVPRQLDSFIDGTLDVEKIEAQGKTLIRT